MHECRPHSNLHGKLLVYGPKALETDHIGYYKPVPLHGTPTEAHYHEEYPHMAGAWIYDHQYLNDDFDYSDLEKQYLDIQSISTQTSGEAK